MSVVRLYENVYVQSRFPVQLELFQLSDENLESSSG